MSNRVKKLLAVAALLWLVGIVATPTIFADTFKNDSNLTISDPINDSLFWGGNTIIINAPIDGDVFLGAQDRVEINAVISGTVFVGATNSVNVGSNGHIIGTLLAGSQNITLAQGGSVRDFRVAATTVNVDGKVERNLSATGTTININPAAQIGRDAYVSGGSVNLNGKVGGNAGVASQDFTFGSNGSVEGKLSYATSNNPNLQGKASSTEKVNREDIERNVGIHFNVGGQEFSLAGLIFGLVSALITGLLLLLLAPGTMRDTTSMLTLNWLPALGWGVLAVLLLPLLAVLILVVTLATGWPVSLAIMALWFVLVILSGAIVGIALGNRLLGGQVNHWLSAILGIILLQVLLWAAGLIPVAGFWIQALLNAFVAFLGFGGLLLVLWNGMRGRPNPVAVVPTAEGYKAVGA